MPALTLNLIFAPPLRCAICRTAAAQAAALHESRRPDAAYPYVIVPVCLGCVAQLSTWTLPSMSPAALPEQVPVDLTIQSVALALTCVGINGRCRGIARLGVLTLHATALGSGVWAVWPRCPACLYSADTLVA